MKIILSVLLLVFMMGAKIKDGGILGLVSIRADLNYQQGLHRMFSRSTRFDFYLPALAHLGENSLLRRFIVMGPVRTMMSLATRSVGLSTVTSPTLLLV